MDTREVLDLAAQKISRRFVDEPRLEAFVREKLGSTYCSLGEFAAGRAHPERVLAIHQPSSFASLQRGDRASL